MSGVLAPYIASNEFSITIEQKHGVMMLGLKLVSNTKKKQRSEFQLHDGVFFVLQHFIAADIIIYFRCYRLIR